MCIVICGRIRRGISYFFIIIDFFFFPSNRLKKKRIVDLSETFGSRLCQLHFDSIQFNSIMTLNSKIMNLINPTHAALVGFL